MRVTPERLAELTRLHEAAYPGPWEALPNPLHLVQQNIYGEWGLYIARCDMTDHGAENAELIAAARTAVPDLIADLQEARSEIERLTAEAALMKAEIMHLRAIERAALAGE